MQIHIWQSFQSNNSSGFKVVAQFKTADAATKAAIAARKGYEKDGYICPHEGEDISDEYGTPNVIAVGATVVVSHSYTDPETFMDNLPPLGKDVGELDDDSSTEMQAFVTLPKKGTSRAQMEKELDAFFAQAESGKKAPPWKPPKGGGRYDTDDLLWFRAGDTYGFQLRVSGDYEVQWIRDYFTRNKAAHWMYLCDPEARDKIRLLSQGLRCPECKDANLDLLVADGAKLDEDQMLCAGCGGMFTLGAMAAHAPVVQVGDYALKGISGDKDTVLIVNNNGEIYRSKKGSAFKRVKRTKETLFGVLMVDDKIAIAVGAGGILRSTNGGQRWTDLKVKVNKSPDWGIAGYLGATRTPNGTLFACGTGAILRSEDAGATWKRTKLPAKIKNHILAIDAVDDKLLFAAGTNGLILRSRDGGKSWQQQRSGIKGPLCRIRALNAQTIVAVGDRAMVLVSTDGGKSWTQRKFKGVTGNIEGMNKGNDGQLYAVDSNGKLLFTKNGKTWKVQRSGTTEGLWEIWPAPDGTLMIAGNSGTLVRRDELDIPLDESEAKPEVKKVTKKKVAKAKATKKKATKKKAAKKAKGKSSNLPTVGRSFLFTGKLASMTRAEAKARVKTIGGVAKSSVTKDLSYLVIGDEGSPLYGQGKKGSKMLAAEKLIAAGATLQIISETTFMELEQTD